MANETKKGATTPGVVAGAFSLDTLLKATGITLSDAMIEGQFRGAKVKTNVTTKDVERVNTGQVNSALRLGEIFKIIGLKLITQDVQGTLRELMLLIIQNTKGDQRAIYSSSLFRSTPTANSDRNTYEEKVLTFNRGILEGTNGTGAPKLIEKLIGNGSDYIRVTDEVQFTVNAIRQVDGNTALPNQKAGDSFEATQRVFALEHITEAEALIENPI